MVETPALSASEFWFLAVHSASGAVRPAVVARPALGMVPPTAVIHGLSTGWPAVTPIGGVHWPVSFRTVGSVGPQSPDANMTGTLCAAASRNAGSSEWTAAAWVAGGLVGALMKSFSPSPRLTVMTLARC